VLEVLYHRAKFSGARISLAAGADLKRTTKDSDTLESLFRKKKNCESFRDMRARFLSKVTFGSDFRKKTF